MHDEPAHCAETDGSGPSVVELEEEPFDELPEHETINTVKSDNKIKRYLII